MNDQSNLPRPAEQGQDKLPVEPQTGENGLDRIWERLARLGLGEISIRVGTGLASIALVLLVVWVMSTFYLKGDPELQQKSAQAAAAPTVTPPPAPIALAALPDLAPTLAAIDRQALLHTILPDRPRFDVIQYEVQKGDSLFGIADKFQLKPETLLFGNYYTLKDTPHSLRPGQMLNILPVDGVYHQWSAGEGLNGVAKYYGVKAEDIIAFPGNHLDAAVLGDLNKPNIEPGTWLVVPGGRRGFVSWAVPVITRKDPAAAKVIGPGFCGQITQGPVGGTNFLWPGTQKYLSGTDYLPQANHPAIDIAAGLGTAVYATEAGVVVYSGWNDWGYGNLVIVDHGNGWQSVYGHNSQLNVSCGEGVQRGQVIALAGSTGNSTGPHIHFELISELYGKVDPKQYLIK